MRCVLVGVLLVLVAGCGVLEDEVGSLSADSVAIEGCEVELPFFVPVDYVALNSCEDILFLRLQHGGRALGVSNGLVLQIPMLDALQTALADGPVTLTVGEGGVRAALYLNASCAALFDSIEATAGAIEVTEVEVSSGDDIKLTGAFVMANSRTGEVVAQELYVELDTSGSSRWPETAVSVCP